MSANLEKIAVVLVEPQGALNIGSVCRVMANFGLVDLRLVNPQADHLGDEARRMAVKASALLEGARIYPTLSAALADCAFSVGTTRRFGKYREDFLHPAAAARETLVAAGQGQAALVFGREDKGVTTDESQLANYFIRIPMAGTYPSLNLSQAVMVVTYEVYKAVHESGQADGLPRMAEKRAFERLTENIWSLMRSLEVREPENGVFDRFCKQMRWFAENRCRRASEKDK